MSRKYVGQINNQNFVYPNQNLAEYDIEIIHDINDNCVSGTITGFTTTSVSSSSISFTHDGTFLMNGAQPFIRDFINPLYYISYLSIHCQVPNQTYMNTWKVVNSLNTTTTSPSTYTGSTITSNTFTITPSMFGLTSFTNGDYFFEFRFIGQNCISKVCNSLTIDITTPTPTPTVTPGGATYTPTPTVTPGGETYTPTPTPTSTNTPTPTNTPTITPTPTSTYTSIGIGVKVGATTCDLLGPTAEIFLNSTDYAIFLANGNCISDYTGPGTVSVIRNSVGTPLSGTFYFAYFGAGSCAPTTFKSTVGNITINATQC